MLQEQNIFSPVQTERVSHLIEAQLKEAIFRRLYRTGDKLPPERELAEMFHASRSSIREALRSLEKSGFVMIKKGVQGGAFVIKGDAQLAVNSIRDMLRHARVSLEEVLDMRLIIEPSVAAEAVENATEEDIKRLEESVQQLREEFDSKNPIFALERQPTFHRIIAEISGNQVFILIMQVLMEIHAFRMSQFRLDDQAKTEIVHQHQEIIKAFKKKDKAAVFEKMKTHVLDVHKMHKRLEEENSESE